MTDSRASLSAALADRYRIERELGQGGMATVYLALDLRHNRPVAVKVLHAALSAVLGPERFLAEIQLTANLQHPHILPLFDSGEATTPSTLDLRPSTLQPGPSTYLFYVMPFIDGETLRSRLERERQLPIDDAVRIAREVADALGYAHSHGVIHRDIKPENILLHGGHALVADFGIALAVEQAGGQRMTQTGMSIGTPQYMSPEQAMGDKSVDHRSDIYALGAVTYEMLAGEPPFTGPSAQAIVARVMTEDPKPLRIRRRNVSEAIDAAVLTALEKLPADRFGTAAEFVEALSGAGATSRRTTGAALGRARGSRWQSLGNSRALILGIPLALLAGAAAMWLARPEAQPEPATRLEISVPGLAFSPLASMSLSPDGTQLVYLADQGLMLRPLSQLEAQPIRGLEGGGNPRIGHDGQEMLVSNAGQMYRVPITGGQGTLLPTVPLLSSYSVLAASGEVIYSGSDGSIWRLPPRGQPVRAAAPDTASGERQLLLNDLLPDGKTALVGSWGGTGFSWRLFALDLVSGERHPLLDRDVRGAWYAGRNTLVYVTADQMLYGVRFDPSTLEVSGDPVQLGGPVSSTPLGGPRLAVSRTGTVAYLPRVEAELVTVNREGDTRALLDRTGEWHRPVISPDGRSVALDISEPGGRDVWVLSLDQGTLTRATFDNDGHDAIWGRDGRSLVYVATRDGRIVLLRTRMDGSAPEELAPDAAAAPGGWTADGRLVATTPAEEARRGWNIMVDSAGHLRPLIATDFSEGWPTMSPDGRWLAYLSDAAREYQVYLRNLDTGEQLQVSVEGGSEPVWSTDGRTLYYRDNKANVMVAARLELEPRPRVAGRETLFPLSDFEASEPHANYDVTADGRMVMVRRPVLPRLVLIQNVDQLISEK